MTFTEVTQDLLEAKQINDTSIDEKFIERALIAGVGGLLARQLLYRGLSSSFQNGVYSGMEKFVLALVALLLIRAGTKHVLDHWH